MKRRRSREYALQILFQLDMTGGSFSQKVWDEFWQSNPEDEEVKKYTHAIVENTLENLAGIDDTIKKAAEHWSLERMAIIDRNILRAATYEMLFRDDIPPSVVMNEALEIAKKFSTQESAPFINGILDKIARSKNPKTAARKKK